MRINIVNIILFRFAMDMCRVCLTTEKQMVEIDETFINSYNLLTNLNVALLDGMPQLTCQTCLDTVKYFVEFREKCITSESRLRELVLEEVKAESTYVDPSRTTSSNDKEIQLKDIKLEVKEEDDDSNLLDDFEVNYQSYVDDLKLMIVKKDEGDPNPKKVKRKKYKEASKSKVAQIIQNYHSKNLLLCGICPKTFEDTTELRDHINTHTKYKQCNICGETSNSVSQLLAHRLKHVPSSQYKCHICAKRYRACLYLEHHYRNVHIEEDSPRLSCPNCSVTCRIPKHLKAHILQKHSGKIYICDICSKTFGSKENIRSHIIHHSDNKSYVCDLCGFSCKNSSGLKDHKIRKHNPKKVYCKNCKRPFASKEAHDQHKCKSADRICPVCGKLILGTSGLSRHLMAHGGVPLYECSRCPAKFKTKGSLSAHNDRHDGNRRKQCEFCPAKFYTTPVLIKHRRTHTGEKPYVCRVCNKGFTGRHNLKVHMKVHGEYLIVKRNSEMDVSNNVTN